MTGRLLLDVTRLTRLSGASGLTGVDRVLIAYMRWVQSRIGEFQPVWNWRGTLTALGLKEFRQILSVVDRMQTAADSIQWDEIQAALAVPGQTGVRAAPRPSPSPAKQAIGVAKRFLSSRVRFVPDKTDVYLNVTHSGLHDQALLSAVESAKAGVFFIHDLIPVTHPEFCRAGERPRHEARLRNALAHASGIIVNSNTTAESLRMFASSDGSPTPPIHVLPLGVEKTFLDGAWTAGASPYFLAIGTIEPRKNFAFLLMLWRQLVDDLGDNAPRLVIVGRRGWECEAVVDLLERSESLKRHVLELDNVGDRSLAKLLAGARALLAPSFAEGFHLPVAEAAAIGAPVIASDIAAHRELLGAGDHLLHPLDGRGWLQAIVRAAEGGALAPKIDAPRWERHFQSLEKVLGSAGLVV